MSNKPINGLLFSRATYLGILLFVALGTHVSAQETIPDFYAEPGISSNRSTMNESLNEYIDPFTGALQQHYVDIDLPGDGGFDLKVIRSYNTASQDGNGSLNLYTDSLAGVGWTIHFGKVIKNNNNNSGICINPKNDTSDNPVIELPDGSRQLLAFTGATSPLLLATSRWKADCNGTSGLLVYSPDGTRYDMTRFVGNSIYATRITDRNGNYATVNYASTNGNPSEGNQISTVTTSDGRTLTFTYADGGLSTRRITQISGEGQTYRYAYQALPFPIVAGTYFLSSVTRSDGLDWSYTYNLNVSPNPGSYFMKRIVFPLGGAIDYTYGSIVFPAGPSSSYTATVLSQKAIALGGRNGPGGTWKFSYVPGAAGVYDKTTVDYPLLPLGGNSPQASGSITYRHFGANSSINGSVWMVGLLMSKTTVDAPTGSAQTETYTWDKQQISSEMYRRPGVFSAYFDPATNAPVLKQKQVSLDGASYTTSFSNFDNYGNPATVSEAGLNGGNRVTTLSYYLNTAKWIVKQVQNESFPGSSTTRGFDSNGNLTLINRDGVSTSYSYDSLGNVRSAILPRSLTHNYSNYRRGTPQAESHPETISIARVVGGAGNITSETDGEGNTKLYGFDGLNRLTSISNPIGNRLNVTYPAGSSTQKRASRGTLQEITTYDGFGRPTDVSLGGVLRYYAFDVLGRKTFESNPSSAYTTTGTRYRYDILDRVIRIENADSTISTVSYGPGSKTVTDERGKATKYSYRVYGDPRQQFLMSVVAPEPSANISFSRNSKDLVTSATQGGFTRSYAYNSNYYLSSVTNPETGTTSFGRDAAGNMTTRNVGSSGITNFLYDGQNRLTSVGYPDSTPAVTNTYNKTNKLLTSNSSAANRGYGYDPNGNLTSESLTVSGIALTAAYTYNTNDQLSSITYPRSGAVVNYVPDVLGRPTQVSGYVTGVTYWPSGQINQISYANGTSTSYNQNSRLWPSTFSTQKGGVYYINSSYTYDGVGNLSNVSDSIDGSYNRSLGYDNINRLTSVGGPWGSGTIAYDGGGNITSQTFGGGYSLSYGYNSINRLTNVSGSVSTAYSYDVYGNVNSSAGNTYTSYTYDAASNLQCVNCAPPPQPTPPTLPPVPPSVASQSSGSQGSITSYTYDGANQRVSVRKAGNTTYEMYDARGNQLIEFTPSQSNKLVEYIYLGGKRVAQKVTP